jgi:hypothetical protein
MMVRPKPNIPLPLSQAVALLIQNQAAFLSNMSEVYQRCERIERDLLDIKATLIRHEQILASLPQLVRELIRQEVSEVIRPEVRGAVRSEMIGFKSE